MLFFGDIVGRAGRHAVYEYLQGLPNKPDAVVANVENVTHGFGLSRAHYDELMAHGVQVMTGGNHSFDRREILSFVGTVPNMVRPCNLSGNDIPGTGARVIELAGQPIGFINLLGQAFMAHYNSPWEYLEEWVPQLKKETPLVFLDFHAESTAEKTCMGHMAAQLGVSAVVGTHTHVQTADERILMETTGYITDAGFNGSRNSIIGMDPQSSLRRTRSPIPTRLEVSNEPLVQVNAIRFWLDKTTGHCRHLQRIHEVFELKADLGKG